MAYCVFCCKTRPQKVILFREETFRRCQEVLRLRKDFKFKYHDIELPTELQATHGYHTSCYGSFTALKQKYFEPKTVFKPNLTNSQSKSESDDRVCIFCGRRQKMKRDTPQYLHAEQKSVFLDRAKKCAPSDYNKQIIKKLESLTTDTFFYHSFCRSLYYDKSKKIKSEENIMRRNYRTMAYKQTCTFVELNILGEGTCYFLSQLLDKYLSFLRQIAETNSDVFDHFTLQDLEKKLLKTFGNEIKIIESHNRKIVAPKHVDNADDQLYFALEETFRLAKLRAAAAEPSTSANLHDDYEPKSDLAIEHVDVGFVSCEDQSESNLEFLPESEEPPLPTYPKTSTLAFNDMKSYCRLCLNPVNKMQMICLGDFHDLNYPSRSDQYKRNKILQTEVYLRMIRIVMPYFDHDLVFNPVMCNDCTTRLQMASDFIEQCIGTQKLIQQYKDTHSLSEKMVSCEDVVVYNQSLLQPKPSCTKCKKGSSQPKQRKVVSESTVKPSPSVERLSETRTFPSHEEFQHSSENVDIQMENTDEEMELEEKCEITEEEICFIKQEAPRIKTDDTIETNVPIKTKSVVKIEPCSTATSGSTVTIVPNVVKPFSMADVSCNMNSNVNNVNNSNNLVRAVYLPSNTPIPNYRPGFRKIAPATGISAGNPIVFVVSSVNSQFQNSQNR